MLRTWGKNRSDRKDRSLKCVSCSSLVQRRPRAAVRASVLLLSNRQRRAAEWKITFNCKSSFRLCFFFMKIDRYVHIVQLLCSSYKLSILISVSCMNESPHRQKHSESLWVFLYIKQYFFPPQSFIGKIFFLLAGFSAVV